jgi:spore germination protein KC
MKPGRMLLFILSVLSSGILLSGCWNYTDIENLSIVTGCAIDKNQQGDKYLLTIEVIDFEMSGRDAKETGKFIESEGKTIADAIRNVIDITGKRLYWAHAHSIIINQDIAKEGIIPVLDLVYRDAEAREEMFVLISTEKTAGEVLRQEMLLSQTSADNIMKMMYNQKNIEKSNPVQTYELIGYLEDTGISVSVPTIHLVENAGKKTAELNGTAVFKADKLVGFLDPDETRYLLYMLDKVNGGMTTLHENPKNHMDDISLEIYESKTKVKPYYNNQKLGMKIDIKQEASIAEIGSSIDYIDEEEYRKLIKDGEEKIKSSIINIIKKVQNDYDSDIFGFGRLVKADMPSVWKSAEADWDKYFKELDVDVNVEITLRNSALISKSIQKGD